MHTRDEEAVFVEASARLHFGVLDLRGARGRWFGGIGAATAKPTLLVSAARADTLLVHGEDAARAREFAGLFLAHHQLRAGAVVHVHRTLPSHVGLGSGTQLALAVARALAELYGVERDARSLATAVGRGKRSAIGTWTFDDGGLVVEGGRRADSDECGPLIARVPIPSTWRCVVAIPDGAPGISGAGEAEAFARLPAPPEREVERVAHIVLMMLLPALADADLAGFGHALSEVQEITGQWFASVQGGTFASGGSADLVQRLIEWGASGVGQSSWGPAVYGIVDSDEAAQRLANRVMDVMGSSATVFAGPFRSTGAHVWRGALPEGLLQLHASARAVDRGNDGGC
jgi:beta-ribofuranosylaminobenzene 5'-phosphate synthase